MIGLIRNFKGKWNGHGGEKRTLQIEELLSESKYIDIEEIHLTRNIKDFIKAIFFKSNISKHILNDFTLKVKCENWLSKKLLFVRKINALYQHPDLKSLKLLLWENNFENKFWISSVLKYSDKKIIAIPQNLESLVPNVTNEVFDKADYWINEEVKSLSKCDYVYCISQEEVWFLRTKGINAYFLPYYPPKNLYENLLEVRKQRQKNIFENFLIIGSVGNPPTLLGMKLLLNHIQTIKNHTFIICGYGTEVLRNENYASNIVILGSLDDEQLKNEMIKCEAIIINQAASSGALTKIPELLVAGIPIISERISARSNLQYEGIYVFEELNELATIIEAFKKSSNVPPIPNYPEKEIGHFQQTLRNCMNA